MPLVQRLHIKYQGTKVLGATNELERVQQVEAVGKDSSNMGTAALEVSG